jgi:hypothetical protein
MKTLCSYCKLEIDPGDESDDQEGRISHGFCRTCFEEIMKGNGQAIDEFLDSFGAPIIVVDGTVRASSANTLAQEAVSKGQDEIAGMLGGEVFGCLHAQESGGCGGTIHCASCVVRNTVEDTYKTGKPFVRVPSCHDLDTCNGERSVRFLISTEKAGDNVLLRIDDIQLVEPSQHTDAAHTYRAPAA